MAVAEPDDAHDRARSIFHRLRGKSGGSPDRHTGEAEVEFRPDDHNEMDMDSVVIIPAPGPATGEAAAPLRVSAPFDQGPPQSEDRDEVPDQAPRLARQDSPEPSAPSLSAPPPPPPPREHSYRPESTDYPPAGHPQADPAESPAPSEVTEDREDVSISLIPLGADGSDGVTEAGDLQVPPRAWSEPQSGTRATHPAAQNHPLPRCLAVANQKGGVGKTTTTVNLGAGLAELGYRVLVVDLDPQGNATTGLGVNARNLDASVYDVILHDVPIEDVIEPTTLRNLFTVPATIDLAGAEIELVPVFSRELRLRRALESVETEFDFVLIDCPPSLGLLTVNALAAAGEVLVPIQCEYYALEGLGQLLRNVGLVKTNLNQLLDVSTIVLTMYDARTKLAEQVADEVRDHFGDRVCRNVVPRTVRLSEAPSFGQPVTTFDPSSRGAIAYRELAKEVSGGAPQRIR